MQKLGALLLLVLFIFACSVTCIGEFEQRLVHDTLKSLGVDTRQALPSCAKLVSCVEPYKSCANLTMFLGTVKGVKCEQSGSILECIPCALGSVCSSDSICDPNTLGKKCDPTSFLSQFEEFGVGVCSYGGIPSISTTGGAGLIACGNTSKTCDLLFSPGLNDGCTSAAPCTAGSSYCVSGKCKGIPEGSPCKISDECEWGTFCNETCIAWGEEEDSCDTFSGVVSTCKPDLVCSRLKVCSVPFTGLEGDECDSSLECGQELVCLVGKCAPMPATSQPCSKPEECEQGTSCLCDISTGMQSCQLPSAGSQFCVNETLGFYDCMDFNQCKTLKNLPGTCVSTHCSNQLSCLTMCLLSSTDAIAKLPASCKSSITKSLKCIVEGDEETSSASSLRQFF